MGAGAAPASHTKMSLTAWLVTVKHTTVTFHVPPSWPAQLVRHLSSCFCWLGANLLCKHSFPNPVFAPPPPYQPINSQPPPGRSALISLSSVDDDTMRNAKAGAWWEDAAQRAMANNSAVYTGA